MSTNTYFASLPNEEILKELVTRTDNYYKYLQNSGWLNLWKRAYAYYYNPMLTGSQLYRTGEEDEYINLDVNHYRNLLLHLKTMTTQQRPSFEPRATNTDYKSQAQTILASGLLEYYMREKKLERYINTGVEYGLLFGEGFVRAEWDTSLGQQYGVNESTGALMYEGDIKYSNFMPIDVIRDVTKISSNDNDWYILRLTENKYTVAAKFQELAEQIISINGKTKDDQERSLDPNSIANQEETDDIYTYVFYHRPTAAVPKGRYIYYCEDTLLLEGPIPYRDIPVYRIAPEEKIYSPFGYTVGFDLLPIQQAMDKLYSTIMTNQGTFGVQNLIAPKGHNMSLVKVAKGLNLMEYDSKEGKPEALNLTSTPVEIFNFLGQLERTIETISGVNSVARGNPEASLKSGAALALVQSMSVQFAMSLQQSYTQLLEDLGTSTINILRDYAKVPRVAIIAGKSNRSLMKQFKGDDLNLINRVVVDMGNPMSNSVAGRVNLAENLIKNGLVKDIDQYIQVLSTGRLEPVIEGTQAELLNIRAENEELAVLHQIPVVITDLHATHILEHKVVLASPEARKQPDLIKVVTDHINQHLNLLRTADPILLKLLGSEPAPQIPPPQGPEAGGMNAPSAPQINATPAVLQSAQKVNMPSLPGPPANVDPASAAVINAARGK
jgi:hypothetical protein